MIRKERNEIAQFIGTKWHTSVYLVNNEKIVLKSRFVIA